MRSLLFIALFVLVLVRSFAGDTTHPESAQQAYEQLISVKIFAFGGVGYAGITSEGELCVREIASSTNGLKMFRSALAKGTTAAQLYALCGIRRCASSEFDAAAAPVVTANRKVSTMAGCIMSEVSASNIVNHIKNGSYNLYFTDKDKR